MRQIDEISQKISFKHNTLIIGAKVTVTELLEDKNVLERIPVLSAARKLDVQIRNLPRLSAMYAGRISSQLSGRYLPVGLK